jgi:hypothetical protein
LSLTVGIWLIWLIWLDRLRPKGRNLLLLDGSASPSGLRRIWDAGGPATLRFFLEVTLIMSKLSGSITGTLVAMAGSK